jgi:YHS domain-containing protein
MSGLVSFLLFGALFFFMMRFGCGAHAGHGGHDGGHGEAAPARPPNDIDPVCGMPVKPDSGYAKLYRGVQYRFCSRDCLDKFDASPDQYLTPKHDVVGHRRDQP